MNKRQEYYNPENCNHPEKTKCFYYCWDSNEQFFEGHFLVHECLTCIHNKFEKEENFYKA